MTGTSPGGIPYIEDDDAVEDYPAHSLALATALDGAFAGVSGGGAGSALYEPVGSPTYADEFTGTTRDPGWSEVHNPSGGASRGVWTQGGGVTSFLQAGGDAASELHALVRPTGTFAVGDAIVCHLAQTGTHSTDYVLGGLVLSDGASYGSGKQAILEGLQHSGNAALRLILTSSANFSAAGSGTGGFSALYVVNNPTYLRLVRTATSTWRADYSCDGVSWLPGTAVLTHTMEPTHMGFIGGSNGVAAKGVSSFGFLRRYSGVT